MVHEIHRGAPLQVITFRPDGSVEQTVQTSEALGLAPRDVSLFAPRPAGLSSQRATIAPREDAVLLRTEIAAAIVKHDTAYIFPCRCALQLLDADLHNITDQSCCRRRPGSLGSTQAASAVPATVHCEVTWRCCADQVLGIHLGKEGANKAVTGQVVGQACSTAGAHHPVDGRQDSGNRELLSPLPR